MKNSVPAVMIGGPADLHRFMVDESMGALDFYELPEQSSVDSYNPPKRVQYKKVFITPSGVHVFEAMN